MSGEITLSGSSKVVSRLFIKSCHASAPLVLVQPLPPRGQANQGGDARAGNAYGKHHLEPRHVAVNHDGLLGRGEGVADLGRARQDEGRQVNLGCNAKDMLNHLVNKGGLGARDEECTAQTLEDCETVC